MKKIMVGITVTMLIGSLLGCDKAEQNMEKGVGVGGKKDPFQQPYTEPIPDIKPGHGLLFGGKPTKK